MDYSLLFNIQLSDEHTELIENNSLLVNYQERDVIFRQNTLTSHYVFLKSGYAKVYKEGRNNKIIILKIVTPGNLIGTLSILSGEVHEYSASAIQKSEILLIDKHALNKVIKENSDVSKQLLTKTSQDGLFIFNRLLSQSHKQLPGRIADVILYFSDTIYKNDIFDFPLTRKELAELAGTTKESFIRTITEFKNDKIIELSGRRVEIKSKRILKILSELG